MLRVPKSSDISITIYKPLNANSLTRQGGSTSVLHLLNAMSKKYERNRALPLAQVRFNPGLSSPVVDNISPTMHFSKLKLYLPLVYLYLKAKFSIV